MRRISGAPMAMNAAWNRCLTTLLLAAAVHATGTATPQRAADDAEGAVKAGADQILLVVIVVVERALGHVQPRRNAIHRSTAIALLVDEVGGCAQKGVCRVVAAGVEHP